MNPKHCVSCLGKKTLTVCDVEFTCFLCKGSGLYVPRRGITWDMKKVYDSCENFLEYEDAIQFKKV